MGFNSSTPSWPALAHLRKRGQRPTDAVFVTDHDWQRRSLVSSGAFAVGPPPAEQEYLIAGLDVILIADQGETTVEIAQRIASARPRNFAAYWRGKGAQFVVGEGA